jgi:hypothetical protein
LSWAESGLAENGYDHGLSMPSGIRNVCAAVNNPVRVADCHAKKERENRMIESWNDHNVLRAGSSLELAEKR